MKKTSVLIMFLLLISGMVYSQDYSSKTFINQSSKTYSEKLHLTINQSKKFKRILLKYNRELKDAESDKDLFNKILKKQTIAIFNLVSQEQYTLYKELTKELEPNKRFKF